jgi:hypothetical protein
MNYRDRGIIKFSPFLMPEHRDMLAELREKEDDVTLSYHDDQRYEQWNSIIFEAMEFALYLRIQYIQNRRFKSVIGRVHYYDESNRLLRFKEKGQCKFCYIPLANIQSIEIAEVSR